MLLDSNIIIYAHKAEYQVVRDFIRDKALYASAISYLETLGYHQISAEEKDFLQQFFAVVILLPISDTVVQKATALRQQRKMTLGDAVIAATALVYNKTLVTRNVKDFEWIDELKLLNPLV
jgi:predicted nucleic acid-binding protein